MIQCLVFLQVQAITWGILSLLGILLYTGDIEWQPSFGVTDRFQTTMVRMYFFLSVSVLCNIITIIISSNNSSSSSSVSSNSSSGGVGGGTG